MHYFRVHPDQWQDRLQRLAAMGLDTVETYIPWNFHERVRGEFDFAGWRDVVRFIRLAETNGLGVIVRPGPFICAEWDNGGLPTWLGYDHPVALRTSDPRFLAPVDEWFDELLPLLVPLQRTSGGPIVAVQVENEYGSFGSDREYLVHLHDGLRARGIDVPLFTSDGPTDLMIDSGTLPEVDVTANFGSGAENAIAVLRRRRPGQPIFCAEFWGGWFDHWGRSHNARTAADVVAGVEPFLDADRYVNL
jgi:beta-galactosidase